MQGGATISTAQVSATSTPMAIGIVGVLLVSAYGLSQLSSGSRKNEDQSDDLSEASSEDRHRDRYGGRGDGGNREGRGDGAHSSQSSDRGGRGKGKTNQQVPVSSSKPLKVNLPSDAALTAATPSSADTVPGKLFESRKPSGQEKKGIIKGWKNFERTAVEHSRVKKGVGFYGKGEDNLRDPADVTGIAAPVVYLDGSVIYDQAGTKYEHRPGKASVPYWKKPARRIKPDPSKVNIDLMRSFLQDSHSDVLKIMVEADDLVKNYKHWGHLPNYSQSQSYKKQCEDGWDSKLGPLPMVMMKCCDAVGALLPEKKVKSILGTMMKRHALAVHGNKLDDKRSIDLFGHRSKFGEKLPDGRELATAWFTDHYRCTDWRQVMAVWHEPIDMHGEIGNEVYLLQWLELMGQAFFLIRAFSASGADLEGLSMRIKVTPDAETASLWNIDLTCFLWGGSSDSETVAQEWAWSLTSGEEVLKHTFQRLKEEHEIRKLESTSDEMPFARRKLTFRPGYTIESINVNNARPAVQSGSIGRQPQVMIIPPFETTLPESIDAFRFGREKGLISQLLATVMPNEIMFLRKRQFQHDKSLGIDDPSNEFTPQQVMFVLDICRRGLQEYQVSTEVDDEAVKIKKAHFKCINRIDFGGYLPLTGDRTFLGLKTGFPGLREIVLPYIPKNGSAISTAQLLFVEDIGLSDNLRLGKYKVIISFRNKDQLRQLISEITSTLISIARERLREPSGRLKQNELELRHEAKRFVEKLRREVLNSVTMFYEKENARELDVSTQVSFPSREVRINLPPDLDDRGQQQTRFPPPPARSRRLRQETRQPTLPKPITTNPPVQRDRPRPAFVGLSPMIPDVPILPDQVNELIRGLPQPQVPTGTLKVPPGGFRSPGLRKRNHLVVNPV